MRRKLCSWILSAGIFLGAIGAVQMAQVAVGQDAPQPEPTVTTVDDLQATSSSVPTIEWVTYDLFKKSDHGFDSFISPISNLVYFEDPRALTEIRPFTFHHTAPLAAGGGSVQLYGAQVRLRLSENVSLIATKDGYVTSSNPLISNGWADIAAGLKFTLLRDVESQSIWSAGFTYELPSGGSGPLQGNGDGELNLFLSGAKKLGDGINWMTASGIRTPLNNSDESMSTFWSNNINFQLTERFYFLTEANWYHWLSAGKDGPLPGVEGLDVINLGSPGVAGNDIVTAAIGFKYKSNRHSELGFAFEFPLTERRDILDNRLTLDWRLRY